MAPTGTLITDELLELRRLVKGADSIELKLTLPESAYRSAAAALGVDPLDAQIRQVFFFDTPDLALNRAGVVARARRVQGRDADSVIKLRPVVPSELPSELRQRPEFVVEVDALPGGYVCSGSLKGTLPPAAVLESVSGTKPLRKLFSKAQRAFFADHAPDGVALDDLAVLGPIFVLKLKLAPQTFGRRIVAEMWLYPDGSRIVELSTKCLPGEGLDVAQELREFLVVEGHPDRRAAGDEDQDGAGVLLRRAQGGGRAAAQGTRRRGAHEGRGDRRLTSPRRRSPARRSRRHRGTWDPFSTRGPLASQRREMEGPRGRSSRTRSCRSRGRGDRWWRDRT